MTSFSDLIQQGSAHAWLFVPSALLLGALHGLEPGHSKTMMAAFIVAIRGTVAQAVLLGLSATLSHTAVVWVVALVGLKLGGEMDVEANEPYFQIASAVLIIGVALWMAWRTWRDHRAVRGAAAHGHGQPHGQDHAHGHDHSEPPVHSFHEGASRLTLSVFEEGVPPRFRLVAEPGPLLAATDITITTTRRDGTQQQFAMMAADGMLESANEIPEPHEFVARIAIAHGDHQHAHLLNFVEDHGGHAHGHAAHDHGGLNVSTPGFEDAHQRAHAADIRHRFSSQNVTTGQIIMFGLTGGLIPCPAAITVLLLCLQLKEFSLGVALVMCFSIGLAATMVAAGAVAALGVRHAQRRWPGFETLARRAPYFSSGLIICVGLYVGINGLRGL